ncbi:MAG: hypothetical protein ACR2PO_16605, partial [Methyloligellaceae bacterium]
TPMPSKFLQQVNGEGLHFLPLPASKSLLQTYQREALTSADYPNLVPPGKEVQTLKFGAFMAVYNWQPNTPRYEKVAKFVQRFLASLDTFRKPPRHPRWQKMDVRSTMPGWQRFQPVQDWLAANAPKAAAAKEQTTKQFEAFQDFLRSQGGLRDVKGEELIKLFLQFQEWQKRTAPKKPPARSGTVQRARSDQSAVTRRAAQ